ncbi:uncharacterized protein LOC128986113 isoform X2 [Macrosteles quadrilineatus]|uniref:uncharacterized protein LOC128986113 isoform X2 n=1 Tax=Macrosteles quadrilineatus TaxID=74068 RepID=UPI0023E30AF7|nr:uncharacterized protein LOC128986113 isoform X2 [Macrosteles quadrilineatus]
MKNTHIKRLRTTITILALNPTTNRAKVRSQKTVSVTKPCVLAVSLSMDSEAGSVIGASVSSVTPASPYFLDSALPSDSGEGEGDHHSSEEELEVINSSHGHDHAADAALRSRSASTVPEKRKWSQVTPEVSSEPSRRTVVSSLSLPRCELSSSSDEEVQGLLATMSPPVQFRTSPPRHAHRPGHRSLSPPPKLFHYVPSPRKRHRHTAAIQRPCLDFEKMQQLKARAVTAWRHSGEHGGELSVFCW